MNDTPDDWTAEQKRLYSRLTRFMTPNQQTVRPVAVEPIDDEQWQLFVHNAAYLAAEFLLCGSFVVQDVDTNEILTVATGKLNS